MPRALIAVTNVSAYENHPIPTGLWLGEAVHFLEKLEHAGWTVDFVSPQGGHVPIDPASLGEQVMKEGDWKHYKSNQFMTKLNNSLKPSQVKPGDYECIYFAGGHGVVWDFIDNKELHQLALDIY